MSNIEELNIQLDNDCIFYAKERGANTIFKLLPIGAKFAWRMNGEVQYTKTTARSYRTQDGRRGVCCARTAVYLPA